MMFSATGIWYVLLLPLMAIQLFALLTIPCLLRPGSRPIDCGRALFSLISQTASIILMTLGGLPTLYSVLTTQPLTSSTYTALLLIFAIGGIVYLWHDAVLHRLDASVTAIPRMIFGCSWKLIGLMTVLLSVLSLTLRLVLQTDVIGQNLWILHLILIVYGMLLTFVSMGPATAPHAGFTSQHVAGHVKGVKRKK